MWFYRSCVPCANVNLYINTSLCLTPFIECNRTDTQSKQRHQSCLYTMCTICPSLLHIQVHAHYTCTLTSNHQKKNQRWTLLADGGTRLPSSVCCLLSLKRSKRVAWLPQNLPAKFTAALKASITNKLIATPWPVTFASESHSQASVACYIQHLKDACKRSSQDHYG